MLGADKTFNDRLCWILVLPLSFMAMWAVDLLVLGLEVMLEGDLPGSATWWAAPLMSVLGGFAAVRMGASVAPSRKPGAALVVGSFYALAILASALSRWQRGSPGAWCVAFALLGLAGAGAACFAARGLPDAAAEGEPAKP